MLDIEPLLAETATNPPCGPDLEYDADFVELERLAQGKPEQQFGATVIPAEAPPWPMVLDQAAALLARSKDLRIAMIYARAATATQGVRGLVDALRLIDGLIGRYWDALYPPLHTDDEGDGDEGDEGDDPQPRINALAALADPYTPDRLADPTMLIHDVRAALVARSKGATLTVRDMLIAMARLAPSEGERGISLEQMRAMLCDAHEHHADALDALLAFPDALDALSRTLTQRLGAKRAPALTMMMGIAQCLAGACREAIGAGLQTTVGDPNVDAIARADAQTAAQTTSPTTAPTQPASATNGSAHTPAPAAQTRTPATLNTREDAIALLDAVQRFIERTEPTNPAPLLIRRAKSLMGKDFVQIIQELAPDSLGQIRLIAGTLPDDG